ncbi:hypothetical protein EXIGLDRAFT_846732 [Exidia glandulosa HHB12029]|uniref:EthD domain-containing protein n=1 Tax=Exidia glandulosa HHB12029 TaxID=1314781 RepID=A0A166NJQ8_EXIGL|nr:hypothetical protein EXIGLDRAFT_846732 [Exidia glandulosa HHB12029]
MAQPGAMLVFTELGKNTNEDEYHQMYENDHCPPRMALPEFVSGVRYRSADGLSPTWMGLFSVSDVSVASSAAVQAITAKRTEREQRIAADYAALDRRLLKLTNDSSAGQSNPPVGHFALFLGFTHPDRDEVERWYREEHLTMMATVPSWVRSRTWVHLGGNRTGKFVEDKPFPEMVALHEWNSESAFTSEEFEAMLRTEWRSRILKEATHRERRILKLYKVL